MFERRLKIVLVLPVVCTIVLIGRLYQIQIVQGENYQQKAEDALVSPPQNLPPLRGRILDRHSRVLVSDEPAHDVTVHYGALCMDENYLRFLAQNIRRSESPWRTTAVSQVVEEVRRRIGRMWMTLECISGVPLTELRDRRDNVCRSVEGLRRHLWQKRRDRGSDESLERFRLREEEGMHAILRDITPAVKTRIELELGRESFVRVEPSVRRVWDDGAAPFCHLLGQIGQVSAEKIAEDIHKNDPLWSYRADDDAGVSGIEALGEDMLRGKRGFQEHYLNKQLKTHVSPQDGLDVQLTLDTDLQRKIAAVLESAVAATPSSTGGSCVVLDVETREILALVSVPGFDPRTLRENYVALRDDVRRMPLRFRAVADEFQPGSIIKPVTLLAGFSHDLVDPQRRVSCVGALFPDSEKWHCWTHWRGLPGHGELGAEEAIQHSCNVYFYTLGQQIGAPRLTAFFRDFLNGPGRAAGTSTGLLEESAGLVPTRDWLERERRRKFTVADARNYAIGQGEIQVTPLQAANIFATLAAGAYREPTLIANDGRPRPILPFPKVPTEAWQLVRRGLDRCVNETGGTAFKYAHMDELQICGKTGSAECVARITERRYTFESAGGQGVEVHAPTIEAAREKLHLSGTAKCVKSEVTKKWPPPDPDKGTIPTHAWFAGYAPFHNPRIALAVILEYGGGGGAAAGPIARQIFEILLQSPHGYITPSASSLAIGESAEASAPGAP